MFKKHVTTVSLTNEVVQCAACINYEGLVTNFVLRHAVQNMEAFFQHSKALSNHHTK
jgi:hypothetical protein